MSALACLWQRDGRPDAGEALARMQRALAIYGRHGNRTRDDGAIAFGVCLDVRRPEDRFDRQPVEGGGGRYVAMADARLDNRPELGDMLGIEPSRLDAMPNSALVLAAWERWQAEAIDRLVGDFAFVVWDSGERVLHLARDPVGFRPLFYHLTPGRVAVASMVKGLHALPDIPRAPDMDRMRDFLALAPQHGSASYFADIHRVEQGQHVTIHADGRVDRRAWYGWGKDSETRPLGRPEDHAEELRAILDRAVRDRVRGVDGLAAHLSAGLDSAAVVSSAALARAAEGKRLTAYTSVPMAGAELEVPVRRFSDEGPRASMLAALYPNVDHVLLDSADREIGEDFDRHFFASETPILNACNQVWMGAINREAKARGERVALSAYFGNMTISHGGGQLMHAYIRRGRPDLWAREARLLLASGYGTWPNLLLTTFGPWLPSPWLKKIRRWTGRNAMGLEDFSSLRAEIAQDPNFRAHLASIGYDPDFGPMRSRAETLRYVITRIDLLGNVAKGDVATYDLETCDPTSDRRLLEFCLTAPDEVFLREGRPQWIYGKAFGERIPAQTLNSRNKGYQAADWLPRLRRVQSTIAGEVERAKASPSARALIDLDDLSGLLEILPEGKPTPRQTNALRLKALRGVATANFLRKLDAGNG